MAPPRNRGIISTAPASLSDSFTKNLSRSGWTPFTTLLYTAPHPGLFFGNYSCEDDRSEALFSHTLRNDREEVLLLNIQ